MSSLIYSPLLYYDISALGSATVYPRVVSWAAENAGVVA
jgi:hypothetical protein